MEPANLLEIPLLRKLRKNINDLDLCNEAKSDMNLVRWLRARQLNISEAEKMLRKHLDWYEEQNMKNILSWEAPGIVKENSSYKCMGYDRQGCPFFVLESKDWENIAQVLKGYFDDVVRYHLQMFEVSGYMMRRQSQKKKLNYLVSYNAICDLKYLTWRHLTSIDCNNVLLTLARFIEQNYPETTKIIFIINAPKIFSMAWAMIRPILSDKTTAKFRIYGHNSDVWKKALLEVVAEDQLFEKYGGTLPNETNILCDVKQVVARKRGSY